jgi:hypothetical protein
MPVWSTVKWILWVSLYAVPVVCIPLLLTRSWSRQRGSNFRPNVRQLFQRGELALISLVIVLDGIWNIMQSQFTAQTVALASVLLAMMGTMAGSVWVECYCRQQTGAAHDDVRGWRDSRNIAVAVFTVSAVMQILLDRFAAVQAVTR